MFGVLATLACSWIIARLGTEIAVCGHDPMEQADTWGKNKKKSSALGNVSLHRE